MPDEDPNRAREATSAPTLRELAMVLFRRRRVFVCVSGLVLAAAVLYAFAGTKYEADMKVLVRRGRANAPVTSEENAPLDLTRIVITEEELNSEVELLRDDDVLRRVVRETGIGGRDWFHFLRMGEGNAERVERAARRLAMKLQVEPVKKNESDNSQLCGGRSADGGEGAAVGGESLPGEAYGGASPHRRGSLLRAADGEISATAGRVEAETAAFRV